MPSLNTNPELLLSIFVATGAVARWLYEYIQKTKWDKNVFLIQRMDEFLAKDSTKIMHLILDWQEVTIPLAGKATKMNDAIFIGALETHDRRMNFNKLEVQLRPIFDEYFDDLTQLIFLAKNDIVSEKHFISLMSYWFDILDGRSQTKHKEVAIAIDRYLTFYGYHYLKNFLKTTR